MTKKVQTTPDYIRRLREHYTTDKALADILGCSPCVIGRALKLNSVAYVYENVAKLYHEKHFRSKLQETPKGASEMSVLMVTLPPDKVDFVSRIVKTLKGEVVEV